MERRERTIKRPWFALLLGSLTASGRSAAIWRKLCVMEWARMAQGANLFVHLRLTGRSGSARQPKTVPADVGLRKSFVRSTIVGKLAGLFERVGLLRIPCQLA